MKNVILAALVSFLPLTSHAFVAANNTPSQLTEKLIHYPEVQVQNACYGCISKSTGRARTNYVKPHFRSNGTYVGGYWRS